jgi:hypothetical protein
LDLHRVAWLDLGQRRRRLGGSEKGIPIAERNDVAEMRKFRPSLLDRLYEVTAAIDGLHNHSAGLGLAQHVSGLLAEIGGMDRDERDAGQRGTMAKKKDRAFFICPR